MRSSHWQAILLGCMLYFVGCSDVTSPNTPLSIPAVHTAAPSQNVPLANQSIEQVAHAIAGAMRDGRVRETVLVAMRDSPWNEHKIVLQDFLSSEAGAPVLAASAKAAGESPNEFLSLAASLPALDFYVPSRAERRSWRGTEAISIEASLNFEGGAVFRFGPGGTPIHSIEHTPGGAVALIHPAELKIKRLNPQEQGSGGVIESTSDGQDAYSFRWVGADGKVVQPDMQRFLGSFAESSHLDSGSGIRRSVTAVSATDQTRLGCIAINDWEDSGNNEVVVRYYFYEPDGTYRGYGEYTYTEFESNSQKCPGTAVLNEVMPDLGQARINADVWESDCGCFGNGDDHVGSRDFFYYDNNQARDVPITPLIHDWVATMDLEWQARSQSVFTSVSVDGMTLIAGTTGNAVAHALDQYGYRLPGYSVSNWSTADPFIASVSSTGVVAANNEGSTNLSATISGVTGSGSVVVSPQSPECGFQRTC